MDSSLRRWGFEQLVQRDDALKFLTPMVELGFFSAEENPRPVRGEEPNTYRVPRWDAMIYLEKAAADAGTHKDCEAAKVILSVLRAVTEHGRTENNFVDNHGTWLSFAKCISALPICSYTTDDLRMLSVWLDSNFDRGMLIGVVLGKELLPRLLDANEVAKVVVVIEEATRLIWVSDPTSLSPLKTKAVTAVDPYWLEKIFEKHGKRLGERCSPDIPRLLSDRVEELFSKDGDGDHSFIVRPAIERHDTQNSRFMETHSTLIDALRDSLLFFVDAQPVRALPVVQSLLASEREILQRIGIHAIDESYAHLSRLLFSELRTILKLPLIHETYRLLKRHFDSMPTDDQTKIVAAIKAITRGKSKVGEAARFQSRLVHAIKGRGNSEANRLHANLTKIVNWDGEDMHPDFLSYMTSWTGSGPSIYSIEQMRLLSDDQLIDTLNSFEEPKSWHGPRTPSIKALCEAVTQFAKDEAARFLGLLPRLSEFKPAYQYAILDGFRSLSHSGTPTEQGKKLPWDRFWDDLVKYLKIVTDSEILSPKTDDPSPQSFTPSRRWLSPVIADLIRNGTHDDHRSIPITVVSEVLSVICHVLKAEMSSAQGSENDAMTEAINTVKGHWIEALVEFSLYICRHGDRKRKRHTSEWKRVKPLFDREIDSCRAGNYEFSTLCGTYLANLHFMSSQWLRKNIDKIFPAEAKYSRNFDCALQGFAYLPQPTKEIYRLMRKKGILSTALGRSTNGRHAREKLLQHISIAYLWGEETLEGSGSLVQRILQDFDPRDIHEVIRLFWSIHGGQLTQEQVKKILSFWRVCISHIDDSKVEHRKVLSDLGLLMVYVKKIDPEQKQWLLRIAPHIGTRHNTDFFVEYLQRLADVSPREVGEITLSVVQAEKPLFDFENRYQSIIEKLFQAKHRDIAIEICNTPGLRDISSIETIYMQYRTER